MQNPHDPKMNDPKYLSIKSKDKKLEICHIVRAIKIALFVGIVLIAINQGDQILNGEITTHLIIKMITTPLVPFAVSLYSSWQALR